MFDFDGPKLPRPLILFLHHLQELKRSVLDFLLCLPTSILAFTLLLLLVYNGFSVFCIHLPFLAKTSPEPANFSPEYPAGKFPLLRLSSSYSSLRSLSSSSSSSSTSSSLSTSSSSFSSKLYVVKEENPPPILKTHLQNHSFSVIRISTSSIRSHRRLKKHKRKLKILRSLPPQSSQFSTRIREFFAAGNCKPRFFMTWISSLDFFGDRELFAIESLFKSHPNACLVMVSNSMDSKKGNQILKPFSDTGFKVMTISPDFDFIFKNTHAGAWFCRLREGNVDPGEVALGQNLSNLLRLALLYKFGGIYVDTDIIILKSFSKLRNVIGAQTVDIETGNWSRLNNAVLIFDKNHPLLFKFIQEFALTFNGNKWGHNGPYLVSRVVSRVSGRTGYNFTILPPSAYYPVDWTRIRSLFQGPRDEIHSNWLISKLKQIRNESFAVHLWNRQSRSLEIEKGSIIHHILSDCCIFCNHSSSSL
ncbi:uncharacterized protein At4g19900 [Ziziphus jujuba]|uniref:Uncharacterized protein At4g19900 n=2 Tax=Ziziphus jujuba TaxID=326968 RepID=A0A6P3ZFN2_ZIZJJ|nr:uncharacterized protein At4g19900 [Ziziphus jujuba]KAH7545964.1 hypothetical protein FEM48_Zijuj01G0150000 [Ziziphus jujuba var. spinosa]